MKSLKEKDFDKLNKKIQLIIQNTAIELIQNLVNAIFSLLNNTNGNNDIGVCMLQLN